MPKGFPVAKPPTRSAAYLAAVRAPRYSLLFALPLLLLYEALAFGLTHDAYAGVRNGADIMLKSVFVWFGGQRGLIAFGALLLGAGGVLVVRDMRRHGGVRAGYFLGMLGESLLYAFLLGGVTSWLTSALLQGVPLALGVQDQLPMATQLMISLGAGIYEELLFRVILVSALVWTGRRIGLGPVPAGIAATLLGAVIFSAFHYVGTYGDHLQLGSFTFRAIAGVIFSALYLTRGFGITAWSHALYDVMLI
jgi:hypothetical protein